MWKSRCGVVYITFKLLARVILRRLFGTENASESCQLPTPSGLYVQRITAILWSWPSLKFLLEKFIPLVQSWRANSRTQIRAYGDLSHEFTTPCGALQGCILSCFLFNLVVDMSWIIALQQIFVMDKVGTFASVLSLQWVVSTSGVKSFQLYSTLSKFFRSWLEDDRNPGHFRWVHCDPGGEIDQPLLYEDGWGKKLTYVFAYTIPPLAACDGCTMDEICRLVDIQDVTWRYTRKFHEVSLCDMKTSHLLWVAWSVCFVLL